MVTPKPSIVAGFSHLVFNVSDLERSVRFYEAATPLRRAATTDAPAQSFAALGIDRGRFAGAVMRHPGQPLAPAIHLVEWRDPRPIGKPYPSFANPGFFRLAFYLSNANEAYDRALASGAEPFGPPLMPDGQNIGGRPVFSTPDPDGIVLQWLSLPGQETMSHVALNARDVEASTAFFEALGLRAHLRSATTVPVRNSFGPPGLPSTYKAVLLDHPDEAGEGKSGFSVDVAEWTQPEATGQVYAAQNNLGIVRLGLVAADLDAAATALAASGLEPSPIEPRDFGQAIGRRRALVLRSPEGAVIELLDARL